MNKASHTRNRSLSLKLRQLAKRIDIEKVDGLLDEILRQIATLGSVSCTLADESNLCLQADNLPLATVKVDRAKSVLRMMCARLSVRCSEWAGKEVSPYGAHVEFQQPINRLRCKVDFENTPDRQMFEIKSDLASATRPPRRAPNRA